MKKVLTLLSFALILSQAVPANAKTVDEINKLDAQAKNHYINKNFDSAANIYESLSQDPTIHESLRVNYQTNLALTLHAWAVETQKNQNHPILLRACSLIRDSLNKGSETAQNVKKDGSWWPDCFQYGDRLYVDTDNVIRIRGTRTGGWAHLWHY